MKIGLIRPPDREVLDAEFDPPFNLLSIASALLRKGFDVDLYDFGNSTALGVVEECEIFGLSVVTPALEDCFLAARELRKRFPDSRIVMGGPHVSAAAMSINHEYANIIVVGECEANIHEILDESGRRIIRIGEYPKELDWLHPLPWELLDIERYIGKRLVGESCSRTLSFLASRGCPYHCAFCYNPYRRLPVRKISPDKFYNELTLLAKRYRIDGFCFVDDFFLAHEEYFSILKQLGVPWRGESTVIRFMRDDRLSNKLANSNCSIIALGIESGSDEMLRRMKKPHSAKMILDAVARIHEAGIAVRGYLLIGFPGETWDTLRETVELVRTAGIDSITLNLFTPFPGTDVFARPWAYGLTQLSADWRDYRPKGKNRMPRISFETEELDGETLLKMWKFVQNELGDLL